MADLFLGQTCTEAYQFISAGTAHTFTFNFPPDKVTFYNLTQWAATPAGLPISVWFRNQTIDGDAYQERVIVDSGATGNSNFLLAASNGFTDASTNGGVPAFRALISAVTKANPCVVTTTAPHGFQTDQICRITDLGDDMPTPRGMSQLDGNRYAIVVLTTTTFSLKDPVSDEPIDSTGFETYVSGGRVDIETRVISLNNPQQFPYNVIPYRPNPFEYDAPTNSLIAGTSVMGADGNVFLIEVIKYGQVIQLGDLVT